EAGGWKGKRRSALVTDRYHTAFARDAVSNLAAVDAVRIHTIYLNGKAIAAIVVLMMGGEAYTMRTKMPFRLRSGRTNMPGRLRS
ncbi:GNAT family N-acetyltransferase, partial [Rhizobium johnstonii]